MAQAHYFIEIDNSYLQKHRRVTGRTRREVELKAQEQLQRWSEQESRARQRDAIADLRERARLATEAAQSLILDYKNILHATLDIDDRLDWSGLMDRRTFDVPMPSVEDSRMAHQVPPERPVLERFGLKSKARRLAAEDRAQGSHSEALNEWQRMHKAHEDSQSTHNADVATFRKAYERGEDDAIERYLSLVLAGSSFPEGFRRDCEIAYSSADSTVIVECRLPAVDEVPRTTEYRYVASRRAIDEKILKEKDLGTLYEDAIIQATLRTVHEVFEGDYAGHCQVVVFNGVVVGIDRATGKDFRACIVSLQAEREAFLDMDLRRVDPRACFRSLRGLSGASIAAMEPVRPIRTFNKEDVRFIEAESILDGLEADRNLMTMPWQDFEILVRDLFQEVFNPRGGEVKVTRTSRDQGVDAVIFDPDPITGGKMIIQAKRYRSAVPVASVRELYGTMLNEGAGKGILVATSHFGVSASEFAKDKPITLIGGAQLLHLLQNHGHHVRIDLNESAPPEGPLVEQTASTTN